MNLPEIEEELPNNLTPGSAYDEISLYDLKNELVLQPCYSSDNCIRINFLDNSIDSVTPGEIESQLNLEPKRIFGCLGIIKIFIGRYLIVIEERECVGEIDECKIFKGVKYNCISLSIDEDTVEEEEKKLEKSYLELLKVFLDSCNFYFSYTYDLTQSAQRQALFTQEEKHFPLWKRVDDRFYWNKYLQNEFIERNLHKWILPVMDDISITKCSMNKIDFDYILISRRSCYRTGARFHIRGGDPQGYVANFVETEQIVQDLEKKLLSSFVQIRGSIPLIWHQKGTSSLDIKPKPKINHGQFTKPALRHHLEEQIRLYNKVVLVNLVDQSGAEGELGSHFESQVKLWNNPNVKYVAFDFHSQCKKNYWTNLSILLDQVKEDLQKFQYFFRDPNGASILSQTGIFRSNCIDCLDRTNVVQSLFARHLLSFQLKNMGILPSDENIQDQTEFEVLFKNVWADNADVLSEQYAGTSALKTDFTRTGKRSVKGMASDGINSVRRVIVNTFQDDDRQASIDLFLGQFILEKLQFMENEHRPYNVIISGHKALFILNPKHFTLEVYYDESRQKKVFTYSTLKKIEKFHHNLQTLGLLFGTSSVPEYFVFSSILEKENFVSSIEKECFSLSQLIQPTQPISLFCAFWNCENLQETPTLDFLSKWIPKGRGIYVISLQDCHYNFRKKDSKRDGRKDIAKEDIIETSKEDNQENTQTDVKEGTDEFSFAYAHNHFSFLLQKYLGDHYDCIGAVSTSNQLGHSFIIALVREDLISVITSIHQGKVRQKYVADKSVKKSASTRIRDKLYDVKEKAKGKFSEEKTAVGGAISFRIFGTPFCFLNSKTNPKYLDSPCTFVLKGMDLATDFLQVLLMGSLQNQVFHSAWRELLVESAGCIYHRALVPLQEVILFPAIEEFGGRTPICAMFSVSIPPTPTFSEVASYSITLDNSELKLVSAKNDTSLRFKAHFLENPVECTVFKAKGEVFVDKIHLKTFISSRTYLEQQFIQIEVLNRESGIIGTGIISLQSLFRGEKVSTDLCLEDVRIGTYSCKLIWDQVLIPEKKPTPVSSSPLSSSPLSSSSASSFPEKEILPTEQNFEDED